MNQAQEILEATDERGEIGIIDAAAKTANAGATGEDTIAVRLGSGELIFVETSRLTAVAANKFRFAGSFQDVPRSDAQDGGANSVPTDSIQTNFGQTNFDQRNTAATDARRNERGEIVVPLIAEEVKIGKKTVETGGVRVHKTVREEVRRIDEPIVREHLEVERVEINRFVETAPAIRYEGDAMIVPVLEEVVVTQKRLLLREEVRFIKRREEIANVQEVTLRREEITLENIDSDENDNIEPGTPER